MCRERRIKLQGFRFHSLTCYPNNFVPIETAKPVAPSTVQIDEPSEQNLLGNLNKDFRCSVDSKQLAMNIGATFAVSSVRIVPLKREHRASFDW